VLVQEDNLARRSWPFARVVRLIPGRDGKPRAAEIRLKNNLTSRALQRLFLMESCVDA
jgi:hypothetical protein